MDTQKYGYYLPIKFHGNEKPYFFSCPDDSLKPGDLVIVISVAGVEAGHVVASPAPISAYHGALELKPILRKADERDIQDYEQGLRDAKRALEITKREVDYLSLPMDLTDAFYSLDGSKVTITYTSSEKRVDFRELLKILAPQLGVRIELRQIAPRDRAKAIGGIGICGLPLCCSTFLNQFEGISIQRAKNQMLTLNIPKLSGPCGKLICCLNYEDDAYTEAKKEFPRFGTVVKLDEGPYTVDGMNVLSRTVRLVDATRSDYKTFPLDDVLAMLNGTYKRKVEIVKPTETVLPSFGLEKPFQNEEKHGKNQPNGQKPNNQNNQQRNDNRNQNRHHDHGKNRGNGAPQNQDQNQKPNDRQPGGDNQNRNRHRNRHRHHHGGGNRNPGAGA